MKRVDYYKTYYENLSPSNFKVEKDNDKIIISGIENHYPKGFDDKDVKQYKVKQSDIDKYEKGGQVPMNVKRFDKEGKEIDRMTWDEVKKYEKSPHIHFNIINSRWIVKNYPNPNDYTQFWSQQEAEDFSKLKYDESKDGFYGRKKYEALTDYKNGGEVKKQQLEIIKKTNPAPNEYNLWVRTENDIKSAKEVFSDAFEGGAMYPDFTEDDMREVLKNGSVRVYSSYPIKEGVFVTPSKRNAQDYAGGQNSFVYSKKVSINDIAWLDESEGQYAPIENLKFGKYKKGGRIKPKKTDANFEEALQKWESSMSNKK